MFEALIRSHNTRQIVVQPTADGVILPKFPSVDSFSDYTTEVRRLILPRGRDREIMDVCPLTLVFVNSSETERDGYEEREIVVLDSTSVNDFPVAQTYSWMGLQEALPILRAHSYSPSMRMMLEDVLKQSESGVPPPGHPYFCTRYRASIRLWIADSLSAQRATLMGPLTELIMHGGYMFLWGPTNKEPVYCKLVHPAVKEAAITAMVHRLFPALVVKPFSIDEKRNVMLSWDFGMTSLEEVEASDDFPASETSKTRVEAEREAMISMTAIHLKSIAHMPLLRASGLWRDTGIESFKKGYQSFIDALRRERLIEDDVWGALKAIFPVVELICNKVQTAKIPSVLCHGDLSIGNLTCPQGETRKRLLFDWHNSTISHPFLDISSLLFSLELEPYFRLWSDYCSTDQALYVYELIEVIRPGWEVYRGLPSYIALRPSARSSIERASLVDDILRFAKKVTNWKNGIWERI